MCPAARRLLVALAALACAAHAAAAPTQRASVRFSAPPSCPTVDAFVLGVSSRTDRVQFVEGDAELTFQVEIGERQGKFVGTLSIDHPGSPAQEPRRVDGARCAEVLESLALTAALSVDPEASLTPRKPLPEPPAPQPVVPVAPPPAPPAPERVEWSVAFGAVYALVLTPGGMAGAHVEAGAHLPPSGAWQPLLALDLSYATTSVLGVLEEAEASFVGATLELCPARITAGRHWITACGGGSLGVIDASGTGAISDQRQVTRSLPGAGLGLRGHVDLGAAWAVELRARATLPLVKRRFYVNNPDEVVASTPAVAPFASIGVVREF